MSPLAFFLIFIVSLTLLVLVSLTRQFQEENILYSKNIKIKKINSRTKKLEKEKVIAETLNGRFAMIGLIAAFGAYLTTGQIVPGLI